MEACIAHLNDLASVDMRAWGSLPRSMKTEHSSPAALREVSGRTFLCCTPSADLAYFVTLAAISISRKASLTMIGAVRCRQVALALSVADHVGVPPGEALELAVASPLLSADTASLFRTLQPFEEANASFLDHCFNRRPTALHDALIRLACSMARDAVIPSAAVAAAPQYAQGPDAETGLRGPHWMVSSRYAGETGYVSAYVEKHGLSRVDLAFELAVGSPRLLAYLEEEADSPAGSENSCGWIDTERRRALQEWRKRWGEGRVGRALSVFGVQTPGYGTGRYYVVCSQATAAERILRSRWQHGAAYWNEHSAADRTMKFWWDVERTETFDIETKWVVGDSLTSASKKRMDDIAAEMEGARRLLVTAAGAILEAALGATRASRTSGAWDADPDADNLSMLDQQSHGFKPPTETDEAARTLRFKYSYHLVCHDSRIRAGSPAALVALLGPKRALQAYIEVTKSRAETPEAASASALLESLDQGVYDAGRSKRVAFCSKEGEPQRPTLPDTSRQPDSGFGGTESGFLRASLVVDEGPPPQGCTILSHSPSAATDALLFRDILKGRQGEWREGPAGADGQCRKHQATHAHARILEAWLRATYPKGRAKNAASATSMENGFLEIAVAPHTPNGGSALGIACPTAGRVHDNNRGLVVVNVRKGEYRRSCMDPACREAAARRKASHGYEWCKLPRQIRDSLREAG